MTSRPTLTTLALLLTGALAPRAFASGFQLREQSPSAQGSAFAGVSAASADIGGMFFNPATLTTFEGFQCLLGASAVSPRAELEGASARRATALGGGPISGASSHPDSAKNALLPNLYAMWSPTEDLRLGLSLNSPFGLVTQYDSGFIGRYHALKSDLQTVDLALNAAYRLHPSLSLGASLIYRRVDAELSNAVDFGSILAAIGQPVLPGSADGQATIKGDAALLGFKAGLVFRPTPEFSLGIAYHGSSKPKVEGTVHYDYPNPAVGAAMADPKARLVDGSVEATVALPDSISLGLSWDLHPSFNLAFEASRTGWSTFKELRMKFGSGQGDSVTLENWRDTWFCSLGATWRLSKALSLRAGIATDQGAAPDSTRTPRIPDGDRTWYSAGLGWTISRNLGVDLAYTHIAMKDAPVALSAGTAGGPDFFRGSLSGTFRDSIDILALSTRIQF